MRIIKRFWSHINSIEGTTSFQFHLEEVLLKFLMVLTLFITTLIIFLYGTSSSCVETNIPLSSHHRTKTNCDMYAKCGNIDEAHELFEQIHLRNVVSWNAIIAWYVQNGFFEKALETFKKILLLMIYCCSILVFDDCPCLNI